MPDRAVGMTTVSQLLNTLFLYCHLCVSIDVHLIHLLYCYKSSIIKGTTKSWTQTSRRLKLVFTANKLQLALLTCQNKTVNIITLYLNITMLALSLWAFGPSDVGTSCDALCPPTASQSGSSGCFSEITFNSTVLDKESQNLKDFIFVTLFHITELWINSFSSETFMFHLQSFGCSPLTHLQLECGTCDAGACVI